MKQRSPFSISRTKLLTLIVLILGAIAVLYPLLVVLQASFANVDGQFTWANYQQAWHRGGFLLAFANSTIVALSVTALQIITSALAGYALARLKFKGKQAILLLILATLVIPFQLLVIPIFVILKWAHLINSYWSLILPTAASGFGIFLMRQYFSSIPLELEEAAALDGANRFEILTQIMLPLARPAIVTLFLFTFIGEWNDLFKPLVFTTRPELRTVQLALSEFQEQFTSDWSLLMAAVVIATVPVLVLFLIGQRQFIQGIGSTGIKN
ncbi:MAG: carbohydrate ABC transporter permease [Hyellaceae cyanobacterium CSU_1_1]|nr:carbohydrate ABC transporter permease [Pleurocapsa sp. CRU_1_2]NJR45112.1 carbohydrate ABC transporter permease [Hyellaceae cyanobacterium CSU_1_1]